MAEGVRSLEPGTGLVRAVQCDNKSVLALNKCSSVAQFCMCINLIEDAFFKPLSPIPTSEGLTHLKG